MNVLINNPEVPNIHNKNTASKQAPPERLKNF